MDRASRYGNLRKLEHRGIMRPLTIGASRVTSRQHFPSDVLVGGTFGYLIGGYVIRHHTADNVESALSFTPVMDVSTHTFGGSIELRPDQLHLARIGRRRGSRVFRQTI
jgi:hypothetical protein